MKESITKALEQGFADQRWSIVGYGGSWSRAVAPLQQYIERKVRKAVMAERAACADICDQHANIEGIAQRCAAEIRARNKT
jgi:hypothetical protein